MVIINFIIFNQSLQVNYKVISNDPKFQREASINN